MIGIDSGVTPRRPRGDGEAAPAAAPVREPRLRPLAWAALACLFLAASGLARARQDRRIVDAAVRFAPAPFALKDLPKEIRGWRHVEGGDQTLDPQVTKIAGSTDHIIRTYVDEATGVTLAVLVIY